MYEYLRGRLASKKPTQVVLDIAGVGYRLDVPLSTFERLGDAGQDAQLFTHLYVREDTLRLYGFATEEERSVFELLLGVRGIGPALALTILSGVPTDQLVRAIAEQNTTMLQAIKGIGKKTAERLVMELREKVGAEAPSFAAVHTGPARDALAALKSLQVAPSKAERAVTAAIDQLGADASVEAIMRAALKLV